MSSQRLSDQLPALLLGSATFNYQFNLDPYALNPTQIVQRALGLGIRAFDTSPYYGPAESILGDALATSLVRDNYHREQYYILTKVGRIAADTFDYSAEWVRQSVKRSCKRLGTSYLDVVYCHDVEFVTPAEVLTAVRELRRLRDEEDILNYVGICGYPVDVLCDLAEMILRETGEPVDVVQSYANFTIQNTLLLSKGLSRLVDAGVDVVTNASPLGMGLLRGQGPPIGAMGDFHPAPDSLREACYAASKWTEAQGEKLEIVAVRFALENWLREGAKVGSRGDPLGQTSSYNGLERERLGVSVIGVSKLEELDETMRVWRSVLDGLTDDYEVEAGSLTPSDAVSDHKWSLQRRQHIRDLAKRIRDMLGPWADYVWASPDPGFLNKKQERILENAAASTHLVAEHKTLAAVLTPPPETENQQNLSKPVDVSLFQEHHSQHRASA